MHLSLCTTAVNQSSYCQISLKLIRKTSNGSTHINLQAIDIWMSVGLVSIIAALIDGALINNMDTMDTSDTMDTATMDTKTNINIRSQSRGFFTKCKLKRMSRVLFPVVYLVFNIIYWVFYTRTSS